MVKNQFNQYLIHAPYVKEIITPMQVADIAGIFYVRIYPDGTIINLANNADWTNFYFQQLKTGHYSHKDIVDQCFTYSGVSLWEFNKANPIWQDAKRYFGYSNGVSICENHANFREVIGFYSAKDDQAMNHFYVNQMDMLKKMKQYFKTQAQELIEQAEHDRLLRQDSVFPSFELGSAVSLKTPNEGLFQNEKSTVVMHKNTGLPIQLSPQRSQCLIHLLQGKSNQQIAGDMHLSPKTIEHYLEMLRKELGCHTSKDLILYYAHQVN